MRRDLRRYHLSRRWYLCHNYTFTNNNPNDVYMLVFTSVTPFVNITPNPVILPSAVAWGGSYTGTVIIDPWESSAGTNICFDLTLADYDGWCCHEMDSICIPIPECDTCQCNKWENFIANVDQPGALPTILLLQAVVLFNSIPAGNRDRFHQWWIFMPGIGRHLL